MLRGNQRVLRLLLLVNLFSLGFTFVPQAANAANEMQIIVSSPDAEGITSVGICFTNPSELSGYVSFNLVGGSSGTFLIHSGTPACPSYAGVSNGNRLTPGTTYNYYATASNNGINFSASTSYTAPAVDPAIEAARLAREEADVKFKAARDAAVAVATTESQAWNAANPGRQKCVEWGPIVHANGVTTAGGGVCASIVAPGPTTTVQTQEAAPVTGPVAPAPTPTPTATAVPHTNQPDLPLASSAANTIRLLVSNTSSEGITEIGFCFTNPNELSGYVSYEMSPGGSGSFLKHAGTPSCPTTAAVSFGARLAPLTTYTYSITANNQGKTFSDSITFTTPAAAPPSAAVVQAANIAALKAQAKAIAQTAADTTPGIQRCSKWSGYGENGQECAYTFVAPTAGLPTAGLPTAGLPTTGLPTSNSNNSAIQTPTDLGQSSDTQTVLSAPSENSNVAPTTNSDSPKVTATIDPTSVQVSQTSSGTSQIGLTTISVEGTTKEIAKLIPKIVAKAAEQKSLATILTKLDAMRAATYSKAQALPNERNIEETAVSLTPEVCSVKGAKVTSLKAGICIFSYELTGASGNTFTVEKQIVFKK